MVVSDLNELLDKSEKLGGVVHEEASFFPIQKYDQQSSIKDDAEFRV